MHYTEEELDLAHNKIRLLEEKVADLQDAVGHYADQLKETQRFLIKLAHNQAEITKRVTHWPYIVVSERGDDEELN